MNVSSLTSFDEKDTITGRSRSKPTFLTLQAGRGIAALIVVLHHVNTAIFGKAKYFPHIFWRGFLFGHAGVEYFFVISGFIIVYLHSSDVGVPGRLHYFLRKRFSRIYPVYWIMLLLMIPVWFLKHRPPGIVSTIGTFVSDVTLIPSGYFSALVPAWTLKHEILFYAVYAICILNRRIGILIASAILTGSFLLAWTTFLHGTLAGNPEPPLIAVVLSPLHLLFLYGALGVWILRNETIRFPWVWAGLGFACFAGNAARECHFGYAHYEINDMLSNQIYGLGAAICLIGFIELERRKAISVPGFLCGIGDASYSIYLVHYPLLSLLAIISLRWNRSFPTPEWALFFAMFLGASAIGYAFHLFVERPLLKRISKLLF